MICSECSEVIRPVIAVDIDGTLGDYHSHFLDFAEQYVGRKLSRNYGGNVSFRVWFNTANGIDTEEYRAIKLAYRQGGLKRSMPVFPGADELLRMIKWHDAELWLTTTRPYLSLDTVIPDTVEWLARNGMTEYDGMLFDEDKYAQLVRRVDPDRIVAVIDDLPDMCDAANEAVGREVALLIGTRYNALCDDEDDRNHMDSIIIGIGLVINDWRSKHGDHKRTDVQI